MSEGESHAAFLGLGSNVGSDENKLQKLHDTADILCRMPAVSLTKCSSVYRTSAWGVTDQPDFLNAVAGVQTTLPALDLLKAVQDVEKRLGRTETYRWGPRVIDIDILLYGMETISLPQLMVPHPYLLQRQFALIPLLEIAPDAMLPDARYVRECVKPGMFSEKVQKVGLLQERRWGG